MFSFNLCLSSRNNLERATYNCIAPLLEEWNWDLSLHHHIVFFMPNSTQPLPLLHQSSSFLLLLFIRSDGSIVGEGDEQAGVVVKLVKTFTKQFQKVLVLSGIFSIVSDSPYDSKVCHRLKYWKQNIIFSSFWRYFFTRVGTFPTSS